MYIEEKKMSKKDFKCGNCRNIQKEPTFSFSHNYDIRYFCETCGPLCKDCYGGGLFNMGECKACGKDAKRQNWNHSGGSANWYPIYKIG